MTIVTWNPADKAIDLTLSGGNLTATVVPVAANGVRATQSATTGKFYWETLIGAISSVIWMGVADGSFSLTTIPGGNSHAMSYSSSGLIQFGSTLDTIATYTTGNVVSCAADFGGQLLWVRVNGGIWNGNGANDPATGTGGYSFAGIGSPAFPEFSARAAAATVNFGATGFSFAVPSGFSRFSGNIIGGWSADTGGMQDLTGGMRG